ncbi:putative death-receptor fusion protein-domain-containing protein [Kickxella alabastrina]|uniref:putative death-receptor fusion protein-domain-containing protein n=1 Tax=Kickxella alabastrina TaxID=61397 RepID=UPI002220D7AC|nr:putative death-receptor fusion protein-domain-containing protein [Kickxella alabastrina]KAI7824451.1 putative death-receptor fusion protein-domain-containing protein [Kickxella alabastrina]
MGILQKDKRGTKGTKSPIPVPSSWLDRINQAGFLDTTATSNSKEKILTHKLYDQMLGLATAASNDKINNTVTWLEQSKLLKSVEQTLAKLTQQPALSAETLGLLRTAAVPMFVECFFLPNDVVVRRQSIQTIKSLSLLDKAAVDAALQANMLAFLGTQGYHREVQALEMVSREVSTDIYAWQTVGQRAQAIELLASIPEGLSVVRQFVTDVLVFSANALDAGMPLLHNPKQGVGSVEIVALRDDCTQVVRLVFLCLSKLAANSRGLQAAIVESMHEPLPGYVEKTLGRVYRLCWDIIGCDGAALNSRQVAAMVLVHLIEGSGLPPADRAAALACRALDINVVASSGSGSGSQGAGYLPEVEDSAGRQRCMDDAVAMVCVARAIVSLAPYETTLAALDIMPSPKSPGASSNVHEAVFTHIASVCGRSQLAPGVKVVVFESMATWLQETARLLARCLGDGSELAHTAFGLGQRVLVLQRERIMGYLWSYWDDPLDAVQIKVKAIFEAFLDIGSAMNRAIAAEPGEQQGGEFLGDVLDLVLTMDWSRRVKYSLLATLCTRIDLLDLFCRQPDILDSCLETLAQVSMAPRAATLLGAMLDRSASDIKGASGADAAQLEDTYIALWAAPIVDALCKDDDTSRRMLAQYLIPNLLAAMPRIITPLLRALPAYRRPSTSLAEGGGAAAQSRVLLAAQQHSDDASRQHALIIVLKAARAQDLLTIDEVAAMDSTLLEMLGRAVHHPDFAVRADMLGLLCEARKLSTPLHEIEYDLLFKLLRVSANAPSADFRQQQHGALTALASRLVTVATHAERIVATGRPPVPSQKVRHREKAKREAAMAQGLREGKTEAEVLRELGVLPRDEMVAQSRVVLARVERAVNDWMDLAVRGCLYPGAGFSKVAMGLRWLDILVGFFTPGRPAQAPESPEVPFRVAGLAAPDFAAILTSSAVCSGTVSAEEVVALLTQVLVDDAFDVNRASAFALLMAWPLGADDSDRAAQRWAEGLLQRALRLVGSTRAGESESGALLVRWVFCKFVVLQGMRLEIPGASRGESMADGPADLAFATALLDLIRQGQAAAACNLLDAAQRFPLHGLLTAAQYVAGEIDYRAPSVQRHAAQWRQWLSDLSKTAIDVCNVVLSVLTSASPEGNVPASFREMEDKIDAIIKSSDATDDPKPELLSGDVELDGPVGPRQQVILSYCWRAVKEVSGLLSVIATAPPGTDETASKTNADDAEPLVSESTVDEIGGLLRTLLTSIRHRGAFSAVHPAFTTVCARMFKSPSAALNHRVAAWLEQCLDIATICQVSVTRRSAGWPLCLLSILTCDKNATQALLPRAIDRIFVLAADLQIESDGPSQDTTTAADSTTDLPQVHAINMLRVLLDDHTLAADIVPYVEHAYVLALTGLRSRRWAIRNVCSLLYAALTRRVFGNNASREESRYDGITGRELFTRFPGLHPFLTNQLEDSVDRLAEIAMCDESLAAAKLDSDTCSPMSRQTGSGDADAVTTVLRSGARFIHPALYPCLILLARLQPSPMDTMSQQQPTSSGAPAASGTRSRVHSIAAESAGVIAISPHTESATSAVAPPMNLEEEPLTKLNERNSTVHVTSASTMLSMYSFTELVELCVDSPVYKTREMASRAFAPLIPSERAPSVVVSLLRGLRESGDTITANSFHGTLCQVHELLRVHWRLGGSSGSESLCRSFVAHVFPALSALWPTIVHPLAGRSGDGSSSSSSGNSLDRKPDGSSDAGAAPALYQLPDIVRHKYLTIINEYVARGEQWILQGISDVKFIKTTRLLLSRFRISVLYGSLHPLFSSAELLSLQLGDQQTPSAYGTVLELARLFLACVDDGTTAVMRQDGSVQLEIEGELVDEHGTMMPPGGNEVLYNPGPAIRNILECNAFYECKLLVLGWLTEHVRCECMDVFSRIGIDHLLPCLVVDTAAQTDSEGRIPSTDPLVRAAATRLLALLCTKLDIDPQTFPVPDLQAYWDALVAQMAARHCPLSVSMAIVKLQAALLHMLRNSVGHTVTTITAESVSQRSLAWAQHMYLWTDPERASPYRQAVSRALVTYSTIKRYNEAGPQSVATLPETAAVVVQEHDEATEEILRLCYWRLLQDDDEDVRDFMADSISRRLGRELACDQACERLVADFAPPSDGHFPATYVSNRLAYLLSLPVGQIVIAAASEAVGRAISPNRVLFDHENPNIYIDEPRNMQLAYFSLVQISAIFEHSPEAQALLVSGAMSCVEALDCARRVLLEQNQGCGGILGATSLSDLFALLQSWVLGARLALFVGSRLADRERWAEIKVKVCGVVAAWLAAEELQPVHPWILRALSSVLEMSRTVDSDVELVSKQAATADLFLLTSV